MTLFTFHLAKMPVLTTLQTLLDPPTGRQFSGLKHAECMTQMTLGAPILSPARMQMHALAMFASWENEQALDHFLEQSKLGRQLTRGWHVRMVFLRRWGHFTGFNNVPEPVDEPDPSAPVVAVTLARMKFLQIPRFIAWGKPVEKLVRDHPGKTFASAAMQLPHMVSTFSIWKSQQEMENMVRGHSAIPKPKRHALAMVERERKNFHFEFTTLRFKPLAEYGAWQGRRNLVPL